MPYKSMDEVNPSVKGIKPTVTLAQANGIAAQADAIGKGENPPESPWAVAIASFKKGHEVKGGKWVKKEKVGEAVGGGPDNCVCPECGEKQEKEVGVPCRSVKCGECGTSMVAEVSEFAPSWKLEVDGSSVPVQELVDAWRGTTRANVVETDVVKAEREEEIEGEYIYALTMDDLEKGREAKKFAQEIQGLYRDFVRVFNRISWASADAVPDKEKAFENLFGEFASKFKELTGVGEMEEVGEEVEFGEGGMEVLDFAEGEELAEMAEGSEGTHARLRVKLIKPGWGNKRDNNYYPKEMLRRDAAVWVGAKMYETNHRRSEKSNRTWVSTIERLDGFMADGSPVGIAAVHDPGFAERARNLEGLGLLSKLECSITGNGRGKSGFKLGGRRGRYIEAITEGGDVDWVTSAGAGGQALGLAEASEELAGAGGQALALTENEPEESTGMSEGDVTMSDETEVQEDAGTVAQEEVVTGESVEAQDGLEEQEEETNLQESEEVTEVEAAPEGTDEQEESGEQEESEEEKVPVLVEAGVKSELLGASNLPTVAQVRLAAAEYGSREELERVIKEEKDYLQEITGAGKPFAMGESASPEGGESTLEERMAEADKRKSEVNEKFGLTRIRG